MANLTLKHRIVLLGDIRAGKSSIISRFVYNTFNDDYLTTIGIDFLTKTVYLDDRTLRLQFWDTAGQERFRSLMPNYIRNSSIALIVFDVTSKQTFDAIKSWIEIVKNARGNDIITILVGNKIDKVEERCITSEEAAAKATDLGAMYIEVSAKTGVNIKNLFNQTAWWLATGEIAAPPPEQSIP